jgi:hypothetical protein
VGLTLNQLPVSPRFFFSVNIFAIGFMAPYPIALIALLVGWLKGFPRWVYPYLVR